MGRKGRNPAHKKPIYAENGVKNDIYSFLWAGFLPFLPEHLQELYLKNYI